MSRNYRFYKNELGWFIDLKYFPFNKGFLAMVMGADILLEYLSSGKSEIVLKISTKWFANYDNFIIKEHNLGILNGAIYSGGESENLIQYKIIKENQLWLCPVTLLVFLRYPKKIFYKVIENC